MSIPIHTEWFKKNNITFKEYTLIWIDVHNVCMTLNPFTGLDISCLCLRQYVLVHPMSFNIQTFETLALSLHTTVLNRHLVRTSLNIRSAFYMVVLELTLQSVLHNWYTWACLFCLLQVITMYGYVSTCLYTITL
mgnify:CR=1 FL=1